MKTLGHKEINGILVGQITPEDLQIGKYADWYNLNYKYHSLNKNLIHSFENDLKNFEIEIYMGTWCPDSHRETPAFFKILDTAKFPKNQVKLFVLDRKKSSGLGVETGKNITHVPTFIFYKNKKEVARIVESPIQSLEEDIHDIVNGKPQTPNYAD